MLRFLLLTTALSVALVPFLPEVGFGVPPVANANEPPTVPFDSNNTSGTVIVNPVNGYPSSGTIDSINRSGTVIVNPSNRYPRGVVENNYGTVIVNPVNRYPTSINNPNNSNPTSGQSNCGTLVMGSPIPSPVPVDAYTGRLCR